MPTLVGTLGNDVIRPPEAGGSLGDLPDAGPGPDSIDGLGGDDVLEGGDGNDLIDGGPGDDILAPGHATGRDELLGGEGDDRVALPLLPQDVAITWDAGTGRPIVRSTLPPGPNGGIVFSAGGVERVAFGVSASELASGAAPATVLEWTALLPGSSNASPTGRPHWSFSDTVDVPRESTRVVVDVRDLLANDVDPDGDTLVLSDLVPKWGNGIAGIQALMQSVDVGLAGFDPAAYPLGLLVVDLDAPLTAPLGFSYRSLMRVDGTFFTDWGSEATVTLQPVSSPAVARDDWVRGTIGGATIIDDATLLANDSGLTLIGGSAVGDGTFRLTHDSVAGSFRLDDLGSAARSLQFSYLAEDALGLVHQATVTVDVDNHAPVATPQTLRVTPGVANTFHWADIVRVPANADPDGDPLTLAFHNGSGSGPYGTLVGFGATDPDDLGGFTFTPVAGYTGGFGIDYGITDLPELGGARNDTWSTARLTFAADQGPPAVEITGARDAAEGNLSPLEDGELVFTLTRSGSTRLPMEVIYRVTGYGAHPADRLDVQTFDVDGHTTAMFVIPAGRATVDVPIRVQADTVFEPDEQVQVTLVDAYTTDDGALLGGPATIGPRNQAVMTIISDDRPALPSLALTTGDPWVIDEDPMPGFPANTLLFTVERTGDVSQGSSFAFTLAPEPGSTIDNGDIGLVIVNGQALGNGFGSYADVMAPGASRATVQIQITPDRLPEPDETLRFTLTQAGNATLSATGPLSATGRIVNDDAYPIVGWMHTLVDPLPEGQGTGPAQSLMLGIQRTGDLTYPTTVSFSVGSDGSGTTSADVGAVRIDGVVAGQGFGTYTAHFAPGELIATIFVDAIGDRVPEPDEGVALTLLSITEGVAADPALHTATGVFTNDDVYPDIAWAATDAGAWDEGSAAQPGRLLFAINRGGDTSYATTVRFSVGADGGSTTSDDIGDVRIDGVPVGRGFGTYTVPFAPGQSYANVFVDAVGDRLPEPDEGVVLTLLSATDGLLPDAALRGATGAFTNDDVYPDIAWAATDAGAWAEGSAAQPGRLLLAINRGGDTSYATTVRFSVGADGGSMTSDDIGDVRIDGVPVGRGFGTYSVPFAPGQPYANVFVDAVGDRLPEPDEGVALTLLSATEGLLPGPALRTATGVFTNDDTTGSAPVAVDDTLTIDVPFDPTDSRPTVYVPLGLLLANDTDADIAAGVAETLSVVQVANVSGAQVVLGSRLAVSSYGNAPIGFDYVVSDSTGLGDWGHVTLTLDPNDAPTDIALTNAQVAENLPAGTRVGLVSGTDPDGDALSFSFAPGGNALGLFRIVGQELLTAAPLDFEIASSHALVLRATDPEGFFVDEAFTVVVQDVAERPGSGDDLVIGTAGADVLRARGGNDLVLALGGNDRVAAGPGQDTVRGGSGQDTLEGEGGHDSLEGESGHDLLDGGSGDDHLDGGTGNDRLLGGSGDDVLVGGAGDDELEGGSGRDLYLYLSTQLGVDDLSAGTRDRINAGRSDAIAFSPQVWADLQPAAGALPRRIDAQHPIAYNGRLILIDVDGNGSFDPALDLGIELVGVQRVTVDAATAVLMLG